MEGWSPLIALLLAFAAEQTGESVPGSPPQLERVDQQEIAQIVCGQPCPARALYLPGRGILIDARLDPLEDLYARSILLHELVHHVQETASRFSHLPVCCRWAAREREAYGIQRRFLSYNQASIGIRPLVPLTC